jgi:hypothetical protein
LEGLRLSTLKQDEHGGLRASGQHLFSCVVFLKHSLDCWCDSAPLPLDRCAHPIGTPCQSIMADENATMVIPR